MSYADTRRNPAAIAAVAAIHLGIGYAVLSGLAVRFVPDIPVVTLAELVPDDTPPPPPPPEPSQRDTRRTANEVRPTLADPVIVELPSLPDRTLTFPPPSPLPTVPDAHVTPPAVPPTPDLARGAAPRGDRAAWVTTEDYPAAALRDGAQGTTGIRVTVGADGRVSDCAVTATSGSDLLDQTACRAYVRRARFAPALDAAGRPVASTRADRVTWRLPR